MNVAWLSVETTTMELQGNILNWTYWGRICRDCKSSQLYGEDSAKLNTMAKNYKAYPNYFRVNPGLNLLSCYSDTPTLPPGKGNFPRSKRNLESLNLKLLGSIGGTTLVSCLVLFICWLWRRYNRAGIHIWSIFFYDFLF